jgi:hypothetical protein
LEAALLEWQPTDLGIKRDGVRPVIRTTTEALRFIDEELPIELEAMRAQNPPVGPAVSEGTPDGNDDFELACTATPFGR